MTEEEGMRDRLIAERCEAATGADRELDRDIELTLPGVEPHPDGRRFDNDLGQREPYVISGVGHPDYEPGQGYIPSRYTASLDAAMSLVPGIDWEWSLEWESGSLLYHPDVEQFARAKIGNPMLRMESECVTPALALCAAALRARASNPRGQS